MMQAPWDYIFVRTRTGKKIHLASPGSSVCRCGHWLKVNARRREVRTDRTDDLCENCYSPEERERKAGYDSTTTADPAEA